MWGALDRGVSDEKTQGFSEWPRTSTNERTEPDGTDGVATLSVK